MGYMGFGMQSWITNMKPKPFFGRRDRPGSEHTEKYAGQNIQDFYHLNQNKLENLAQKKPSLKYMKTLRTQIREEKNKQMIRGLIIIAFSLLVIVVTINYLNKRIDLF